MDHNKKAFCVRCYILQPVKIEFLEENKHNYLDGNESFQKKIENNLL